MSPTKRRALRPDMPARAPWQRLLLALTLVLGALATLGPTPARAANVAVTNTNDSGGGSLRKAILDTEANAGADTILFSLPGSGPWTITLAGPLPAITKPLTIIGPGQGQLTIQGNNTFRLVTVNAPGQAVSISGLRLTKGRATGSYGGNLRSIGGDLTLHDVALTDGTADDDQGGAGAYLSNGTIALGSVLVSGNVAKGTNTFGSGAGLNVSEYQGSVSVTIDTSVIADNTSTFFRAGGLMLSRASGVAGRTLSVTLANSLVSGNKAEPNSGAGIYNDHGTLILEHSTVGDNSGQAEGAGIYNQGGDVTLTGSTLRGNTAGILHGGGLHNEQGTVLLTNSTIRGNVAAHSGGGLYNDRGAVTLVGSTVSGNQATYGAGLYNYRGTATLLNSTVSGNSAAYAGGVENTQGTLSLAFTTVAANLASFQTGGLGVTGSNGSPATTTIGRSIIAGNLAPADADCSTSDPALGPLTSAGYNVVGDGTGCSADGVGDATAAAPAAVIKGVLANNGGPTKTHALVFNSPAIDRVPCVNTIDQRGTARPQGGKCDSGAFEATGFSTVALTLTTSGGGAIGRNPAGGGNGPYTYTAGAVVTLTPQPSPGTIFTGWTVDGLYRGWADPLTITMAADYTVHAVFAPVVGFADVGIGRGDWASIRELASRGTIKGYGNGMYGPDNPVTRAQMAALIARAMPAGPIPSYATITPPACLVAESWDCEQWVNYFLDKDGVDGNLWRDIGALAHYGVAKGYSPETCAALGRPSPCFGTNDPVSYAQTISFIARAMVAKGFWVAQPGTPQPYAGVPSAHAADVATFHFYTGGVPAPPADWNAGATRGWFARALWAALDGYWGTDGTLPGGKVAGGFVP